MFRTYVYNNSYALVQSATLPVASLVSAANVQPEIFNIQLSSESAVADAVCKYILQRFTAAGTPGSTPASVPLNPTFPASQATTGLGLFTVGPTLTAGLILWQQSIYQRASYNWYAKDGCEITLPSTAANGVALLSPVIPSGAFTADFGIYFRE